MRPSPPPLRTVPPPPHDLLSTLPPQPTSQYVLTFTYHRIALTAGQIILRNGGVIRGMANWGVFQLPRPVSRAQMKHKSGHYFVMRYDASSATHSDMRNTINLDPRVIRTAHVKLGDGKLQTAARFGDVKWDGRH